MQALGGVRQEIAVLVHRAALHRNAIPHRGNRALKPGAAMDEMKWDKMGGVAVLGLVGCA